MIYLYSAAVQIDKVPFGLPIVKDLIKLPDKIVTLVLDKLLGGSFDERMETDRELAKEKKRQNFFKNLPERIRKFDIDFSRRRKEWEKSDKLKDVYSKDEFKYILGYRREYWFKKQFTKEEWERMHPHIIEEENKNIEEKKDENVITLCIKLPFKLTKPEIVDENQERIKNISLIRVAFKICCIFFCIYLAYPMI